ncbi:MAG: hypothetical protein K0S07_1652, partial [Chlamydiales bacterium]|nr:hypothetical protein [Chlamydiales bacterium]
SASFGVSASPSRKEGPPKNLIELIELVDKALYRAKSQGGNCVSL